MADLNQVIHQPVRLRIMATLTALETGAQLEFTHLRSLLKVTDGNLGAHLRKLEAAGYITLQKAFLGRKPCTYAETTPLGQHAFADHLAALAEILQGEQTAGRDPATYAASDPST